MATLCVVSLSPALVFADGAPKSVEDRGSIKSVNAGTHTLVVTEHTKSAERKFQWNDQTKFSEGDKSVNASALKQGERVHLIYVAGSGVHILQSVHIISAKTGQPGASNISPAKSNDA